MVRNREVTLRGAVVRKNADPAHQTPIAGVEVTAKDGALVKTTKTDTAGAFALTVGRSAILRHPLTLNFSHTNYQPSDIFDPKGDRLYIVAMTPIPVAPVPVEPDQPLIHIGNISVRYTVKTEELADVGSGVKTFQIVNKGDVACEGHTPCSPDGKWKAAVGSASLDAGQQN